MERMIEGQVYVAELRVPSYFHIRQEVRKSLPNPAGFEVSRGYWMARPPDERSALQGYAELTFTILFVSKTLKEAEDHALRVGRMFSTPTSAFGGYPLAAPRLHRIASVDAFERLLSQHNYYYDDQLHESLGVTFDPIVEHRYQRYLQFFSSDDESTKYRIQSAMHWYGVAVGSEHPTVSYVAAWTGLECIGLLMDGRFHEQGDKAPCSTCGNPAGKKRDRKMAGIEHVFKSGAVKSSEGFSYQNAHNLRNEAVHGLREIEPLLQDCSEFFRYLIDLLGAAIQTAVTPPEYNDDSAVKSLVAGDYEFRPCSRMSIKFSEGQMEPYLDDNWVVGNLLRESKRDSRGHEQSEVSMSGERHWQLDASQREYVESECYEEFTRVGQQEHSLSGRTMPNMIPWKDRPSEPAWEDFTYSDWEII